MQASLPTVDSDEDNPNHSTPSKKPTKQSAKGASMLGSDLETPHPPKKMRQEELIQHSTKFETPNPHYLPKHVPGIKQIDDERIGLPVFINLGNDKAYEVATFLTLIWNNSVSGRVRISNLSASLLSELEQCRALSSLT